MFVIYELFQRHTSENLLGGTKKLYGCNSGRFIRVYLSHLARRGMIDKRSATWRAQKYV